MLMRSLTAPTVRGLASVLAPVRAHALDKSGLQRPLYALYVQSASKASLPQDPERPKRPSPAYFRFAAMQRENGVKSTQEVAAAWKQASPTDKQPFVQATAADVVVYNASFEKYKASGKYDAWRRDPAKPKRPLTAFFAWARQERLAPDMAKLPVAQAAKVLGSNWAKLPADSKAPFEAKFEAAKAAYDTDMKVYKDSGADTAWLKRTGRLEIIQKAEAKKQAQKDRIKEAKVKKMASDAKAKENAKAAKEKAADKEKAAAKKAAKVKADKAKEIKAKAAKAKATKAKAAKIKAAKAAAAKAAAAKKAKEEVAKAKAAAAAKGKSAKEKLVVAKAAKAAKAKAAKAKTAK